MRLFTSSGSEILLGDQIGRGGEGSVFEVAGDKGLVAKLYREPIDDEKAGKLAWMAANGNERLLKVAAWIVETLHEDSPDGRVVGFLMPNVRAKEIHELYSLKSRRIHFPHATWPYLVHAAANVARAFYSLHANGHVMGDVNHGNCVVLRDGTVKLIDCDSYSISRGDFRYRCDVGVGTHLAPELQGRDLGEIERVPNHDNFGLAVIVFQLLFLGRHPFSGMFLGEEDKSLEDCIRERRFAWGEDAESRLVRRPPGTLPLTAVGNRLAALFNRAFLTDTRPEPKEWIEALEDLSGSLEQCLVHVGHQYFKQLPDCPFCKIETQTGLILFPFVSSASAEGGEQGFNIFTIESLLRSLEPVEHGAKPRRHLLAQTPPPPPSPIATGSIARRELQAWSVLLPIGLLVVVLWLASEVGSGAAFFIGAIVMAGFVVVLNNLACKSRGQLEEKLEAAHLEWSKIEAEWDSNDVLPKLRDDLDAVRRRIDEYHVVTKKSRHKTSLIFEQAHNYRLDSMLRSSKIVDAGLVSTLDAEILRRAGIVSAADVDASKLLGVPDLADDIADRLIEWRARLGKTFKFDGNDDLVKIEVDRSTKDLAVRKTSLEREIETLVGQIRAASTLVEQRRKNKTSPELAARNLAQCESDLQAAGNVTIPIVAMIGIVTLVPFLIGLRGQGVRELMDRPTVVARRTPAAPVRPNKVFAYPMSESEVNRPSWEDRVEAARQIALQAKKLNDEREKQVRARKTVTGEKLFANSSKEAVKIAEAAVKIHSRSQEANKQLGRAYFYDSSFDEAIKSLGTTLEIDPNDTEAKYYLARNLIEIRYFEDAHRALDDLIKIAPANFDYRYYSGLSLKGLELNVAASNAFRAAIGISPNDADAHYQLALVLHTLGTPAGEVAAEYLRVNELNQNLAKRLRTEVGLTNAQIAAAREK